MHGAGAPSEVIRTPRALASAPCFGEHGRERLERPPSGQQRRRAQHVHCQHGWTWRIITRSLLPQARPPRAGSGGGQRAAVAHCQRHVTVYVSVEILQTCRCYTARGAGAYGYAR